MKYPEKNFHQGLLGGETSMLFKKID